MEGSLLVNNLRKIISLVDNLRDLGLEELIKLPKVVVVGSQSSGKSSLLQQIVGIDFLPRGSGVVTRRPLELRLTYDANLKQPQARFVQIPNTVFTNFTEVCEKIQFLTDKICGKEKVIKNEAIILNISSNSCPNITIVDLPGITSIPVGKQPDNIYEITKEMVLHYIKDERSIILCVMPANQDLSTSQALKITQQIDPRGSRSLGCLTKVDIMDRGTNARSILLNEQIPLKYGYVGIKNRSQQDINQKKLVSKSLEQQKLFFANSPAYSTLPPGCTGTQALTQKITKILYTQIKESMPNIITQISSKTKEYKQTLTKLGPGIAKTPQQLIDYVWKIIAKFLKVFKNSLDGIRDPDNKEQPFGPKVRARLTDFYRQEFHGDATEELTDKMIQTAIYNFPGQSIPGFPSIDAFLALLNPELAKLKSPALLLIDETYNSLQNEAKNIIDQVMLKKYPVFNQKFNETISKVFENARSQAKTAVQQILDSQFEYLYTNDVSYLMGEFKVIEKETKKNSKKKVVDPLVFELRKRIDAYFHLVVRNLRDLIPKQVSYFLIFEGFKQVQFEAYNFIGNFEKLEKWFEEPKQTKDERDRTQKALATLQAAEKRIKRDPEFGKMIKNNSVQQKYYSKIGIKIEQKQPTPEKYIYKGRKSPPKPPKPSQKPQDKIKTLFGKSDDNLDTTRSDKQSTNKNNPSSNPNFNDFRTPPVNQNTKSPDIIVKPSDLNKNVGINNSGTIGNNSNTSSANNINLNVNVNNNINTNIRPPNNVSPINNNPPPKAPNYDFLGGYTANTTNTNTTNTNTTNQTNNNLNTFLNNNTRPNNIDVKPPPPPTINNNPPPVNPLKLPPKNDAFDNFGLTTKPQQQSGPNTPGLNTNNTANQKDPKDQKKDPKDNPKASIVTNLFGFGAGKK